MICVSFGSYNAMFHINMLSHTMSQYIPKDIYYMHARISLYDPTDAEFQGEEKEISQTARPYDGIAFLDYLSKNKEALEYADLTSLINDIGYNYNTTRHLYNGGNKMSCQVRPNGNKLNILFVTDIYEKFSSIKTEIFVTASIPFIIQIGDTFYGLTLNFLQYLRGFPAGTAENSLLLALVPSP